ncbi:macrophage migration inhibitory factor homolog [Oppia nitens]|uniref:macrophage migration inhibitory factor homolog n=1 Tax=Oppia nitens TaxID=1686743 RepID=UPI0023DC1689|nr:macrophage migration inhibitory factor homolog [Oppia nitens]
MPWLEFYTTLPASKIPIDFQPKLAKVLYQVLPNKQLQRICVHLVTDQNIYTGTDPDNNQPKAYGVLRTIGGVTLEDNRRTMPVLADHVQQELGISPQEFRMFFTDLPKDMYGVNGKIFHDLLIEGKEQFFGNQTETKP